MKYIKPSLPLLITTLPSLYQLSPCILDYGAPIETVTGQVLFKELNLMKYPNLTDVQYFTLPMAEVKTSGAASMVKKTCLACSVPKFRCRYKFIKNRAIIGQWNLN